MVPLVAPTEDDWDTIEGCLIATCLRNEEAAFSYAFSRELRLGSAKCANKQRRILERLFGHPTRKDVVAV